LRFVPIDGASNLHSADPFADVIARDAVLAPLADLPADLREIVVLRYWADLPLDEVAVVLGIPAGTARSRLHRALERLRASVPPEAIR
jgi:RNA polymerase sigma factor (sigma-70 family)